MALTDNGRRSVKEITTKFPITLADNVREGDLIGYNSGWVRAFAQVSSTVAARFIAMKRGVSGDVIEITPAAIVTDFTLNTIGGAIYLSEDAPNGKYTQTAPTTTNDIDTIIGYAISETEIYVNPTMRADSLAP